MLRRFGDDVVGHSRTRVQPERGRRLKAAAQGDQHIPRYLTGAVTHGLGLGAIKIDEQLGLVGRLLDAQVGGAGNVADLLHKLVGEATIRGLITAYDLNVDGRRQSEIENLAYQVRR